MEPALIRIAIVESLGWTRHRNSNTKCSKDIPEGIAIEWEHDFVPPEYKGNRDYRHVVPQFHRDLNEMARAERSLKYHELKQYEELIANEIIAKGGPWRPTLTATAMERATAFLKLKGKWIETPKESP